MSRENKFRAWDIEYQKMYLPTTVLFVQWDKWEGSHLRCEVKHDSGSWALSREPGRHVIMEYSGVNDIGGIECYEGDIVKCTELRNDEINEWISEVYWEEASIWVHESSWCDTPLDLFFPGTNKQPLTEIEVIGNIYDNQKLLADQIKI